MTRRDTSLRRIRWACCLALLAGSLTALCVPVAAIVTPSISTINPASGAVAGGATVFINGSNLVSGSTVTFGGAAAAAISGNGSSQLVVRTPPHTTGPMMVTVSITAANSGSEQNSYTFGLAASPPPAAINEFSSGLTAGAHPEGSTAGPDGNLRFAETLGNKIGVLFIAPPTITAATPSFGPANVTTPISLSGMGIAPGASVIVGGAPATNITIVNPTTLTCIVPTHTVGTVDIIVTNPGGGTTTMNGYTYGTPTSLPKPNPPGGTPGSPNTLPSPRDTGGSPPAPPAPLPNPRP